MLSKLTNLCRLLYWVVKLVEALFDLALTIYSFIEMAINYIYSDFYEKIRMQICNFS